MPIWTEREAGPERLEFWKGKALVTSHDILVNDETDLVKVVDTQHTGKGLEAKEDIKSGSRIFGIHGIEFGMSPDTARDFFSLFSGGKEKIVRTVIPNQNPDLLLPNAVCVDYDTRTKDKPTQTYINPDPNNPLRYLNHSCDPNAERLGSYAVMARRAIAKGEPITIDYATLDIDPDWSMTCNCGSPNCRGEIRSIQFLTPEQIQESWDKLPGFMQHVYLETAPSRYTGDKDKEVLEKLKESQRASSQML